MDECQNGGQATLAKVAYGSSEFLEILALRKLSYQRASAGETEELDEYSHHFIAIEGNQIIGALRVTCLKEGKLESQEKYPPWMLEEFSDRICAASRLCVREDFQARTSLPIALTGYAWRTLIPQGIRVDISKARADAIPFYMRKIGQWFVRDSFFPFGKWNVMCGLIVYPANPLHPGAFSKQFEGITAPCNLAESKSRHLYIDSPKEFLRARRSTPNMGHQTP